MKLILTIFAAILIAVISASAQESKREKVSHFYTTTEFNMTGAAWIYKINGKYEGNSQTGEQWEVIDENVGDVLFVGGWQLYNRIT
jgi:hypothetical protein